MRCKISISIILTLPDFAPILASVFWQLKKKQDADKSFKGGRPLFLLIAANHPNDEYSGGNTQGTCSD